MPTFRLRLNEKNMRIAEFLEAAERGIKVECGEGEITVSFSYGFTVSRLEIGSALRDLTDEDWKELINEIKATAEGGKVREFSDMSFGVRPTRVERVFVRLDPSEKHILQEAAVLDGKSLSEFIRNAALKVASEVFDRNTIERQTKRQDQQKQQEPYLA